MSKKPTLTSARPLAYSCRLMSANFCRSEGPVSHVNVCSFAYRDLDTIKTESTHVAVERIGDHYPGTDRLTSHREVRAFKCLKSASSASTATPALILLSCSREERHSICVSVMPLFSSTDTIPILL